MRSREYAPQEMASFTENQEREGTTPERRTAEEFAANGARQIRLGWILVAIGAVVSVWLLRASGSTRC